MNRFRLVLAAAFAAAILFLGTLAGQERDSSRLLLPDSSEELADRFAGWLIDFGSDEPETRKSAQLGWQSICLAAGAPGNEARLAEVNRLMTEQLGKDLDPVAEAWLLYLLRWTANDEEIPAIAARLSAEDPRVRGAALRAVATVPTPLARETLEKARTTAPEAYREEIEQTLRTLQYDYAIPTESESPQNLPYLDDAAVAEWMAGYERLDPTAQARTLAALTVRGDRRYRPVALAAIASQDADLRRNGLLALEKLGTADDLSVLLDTAVQGERELARTLLTRIADPAMDQALLDRLQKTDDPTEFALLADVLVDRPVAAALPPILDGAKRWADSRAELILKAERIATKNEIGPIVELMCMIDDVKSREQVERAVMRLCQGDGTPVAARLTPDNRAILLPCLGRIGGAASWEVLQKGIESNDPAERETAVKALCNWPNAERYAELLALAQDKTVSPAGRIAALRGTIRVVTLPPEELGVKLDDAERLDLLKRCFRLAERTDDRRLALDRAKSIRTLDALSFVMEYVEDPELANTALNSALELAHHDFLRKQHPAEFRAALEKILTATNNPNLLDRARKYLDQMK